jgi:hypothetical protein
LRWISANCMHCSLRNYQSVYKVLGLPLFFLINQCCLSIFKFVAPCRHFLSTERVLTLNTD